LASGDEELEEGSFEDLLPLAQRGLARLLLLADLVGSLADAHEAADACANPEVADAGSLVRCAVRYASRLSFHTLVDVQIDPELPFVEVDSSLAVPCIASLIDQTWRRAGTTVAIRVGSCERGVEIVLRGGHDEEQCAWSEVPMDDETGLREKAAKLVTEGQGARMMCRGSVSSTTAYRIELVRATDDGGRAPGFVRS